MKAYSVFLMAGCAFVLVTGCSRLTESNLEKIHNGMRADQVKAIFGDPPLLTTQTDYLAFDEPDGVPANLSLTAADKARQARPPLKSSYFYQNSNAEIEIDFERDKVVGKKGTFK